MVVGVTIFQLLLYSCVVSNGMDGLLMSKTCDWRPAGFYRVEGKCGVEGSQQHGKPVREFVVIMGSPRKVEGHKCQPITVD